VVSGKAVVAVASDQWFVKIGRQWSVNLINEKRQR
jgi:hypothetical protein